MFSLLKKFSPFKRYNKITFRMSEEYFDLFYKAGFFPRDLIHMMIHEDGLSKKDAVYQMACVACKVIDEHLDNGKKVNAIKTLRQVTDIGLRESKCYTDHMKDETYLCRDNVVVFQNMLEFLKKFV